MDNPFARRPPLVALGRRAGATAILALFVLGAMPWPVFGADPSPEASIESPGLTQTIEAAPVPLTPTPSLEATLPTPEPIVDSFVIYRRGAIVRQYTRYTCVPATTQTMLNLIKGTSDRSVATQMRYYKAVRKNNRYTYRTLGNDPRGWAWGLRYFSGGTANYRARAFDDKATAMWAIQESIARTGSPVGITVWGGTHAWVVLGYKTASDPLDPSRKTLLGFYVSGPLGSSSKDPWTNEYMDLAEFKKHFSRYHEWQRRVIWEDRWVIVSQ